METKRIVGKAVVILAVILLMSTALSSPIIIYVEDFDISPQMPTISDTIDIIIEGGASLSGSNVEYSVFSQNGASLQLDLFVNVGMLTVPSTWSHIEQVGPFAVESYSLTVRAFEYQDGTFKDSCTKDFIVTPEPTTLLIICSGLPFLRKRHRF